MALSIASAPCCRFPGKGLVYTLFQFACFWRKDALKDLLSEDKLACILHHDSLCEACCVVESRFEYMQMTMFAVAHCSGESAVEKDL